MFKVRYTLWVGLKEYFPDVCDRVQHEQVDHCAVSIHLPKSAGQTPCSEATVCSGSINKF